MSPGQIRFQNGDTWVWRVTDNYTGNQTTLTRTVAHADEARVVFSDGTETDQLGNYLSELGMTFTPIRCWIPSDLVLGTRWNLAYSRFRSSDLQQRFFTGDGQVVAREKVVVPGGRFDAFKLEIKEVQVASYKWTSLWIDSRTFLEIKRVEKWSVHGLSPIAPSTYEFVSGPPIIRASR